MGEATGHWPVPTQVNSMKAFELRTSGYAGNTDDSNLTLDEGFIKLDCISLCTCTCT
jgi:hypothetical protein